MHHQRVRRVLIAGGGIGGLVTAIALQREGLAVSVFERVEELVEVGAGLTLWANALRALHRLGLTDMLETVGKPLTRSCILSWQGEILTETPVEALTKRFGTPLGPFIAQTCKPLCSRLLLRVSFRPALPARASSRMTRRYEHIWPMGRKSLETSS